MTKHIPLIALLAGIILVFQGCQATTLTENQQFDMGPWQYLVLEKQ